MSAYIVDESTIAYLVHAGLKLPRQHSNLTWRWGREERSGAYKTAELRPADHRAAERVGQMLWDENTKSVNHRYSDDGEPPEYEHKSITGDIDPLWVLELVGTYTYQSCGHPDWRESEASAYVEALRKEAMRTLTEGYNSYDAPEIKETEWGLRWEDPNAEPVPA